MKLIERICRHISDSASPHRKIVLGFMWIILFVAIGKLAAVAKEMVLAWRYGTGPTVDAYVFVMSMVMWPIAIWFNTLHQLLVPQIIGMKQRYPDQLARFQREFFGFSILAGAVLALLIWFVLTSIVESTLLSFDGQVVILVRKMTNGLVFMVPFSVVSCFISAWMLAYVRHDNTIFEAIPSIVILVALLLQKDWMEDPLLWSTVVGYFVYMLVLTVVQRQRKELHWPILGFRSAGWMQFWSSLGFVLIVQIMTNLTVIVDQLFAARMEAQTLSVLGYVNRVMGVILAASSIAITRATLPIFAALGASDPSRLNAVALSWTKWILIGGVTATVVCGQFSEIITQTLFQRGAFTAADTEVVAKILQYALIPVPFFSAVMVLSNLVVAQRKYNLLLGATFLGVLVKVVASITLAGDYGLQGLFIASAISYFTIITPIWLFTRVKPSIIGG